MKIGFDAKRAFLNYTGLGNYSRDSIRILGSHFPQHEYHLYTPEVVNNGRLSFIDNKGQYQVHTPTSFLGKTFKGLWRSVQLSKVLANDKITLYHGLSHELPRGIEHTNVRAIVTIHDLIFVRYPHLFKAVDRAIYFKKFTHACEVADHIIAVSKQTKEDLITFFAVPAEKITVIYQGCHQIFQQAVSSELKTKVRDQYQLPTNYLLSVGTIEERKNLLTTLKSLPPNQHLIVVGDGKAYKEQCLDYIEQEQLQQQVTFLSGLSLEELAAIYQQADLLIYPSLFEGFGIPILEALFSKIPVITTKGGCFSEAGGPNSCYINAEDSDSLRSAILKIQSDDSLRESMINNGLAYAQQFTDDKIANRLMNLYLSTCEKR